MKWTKPQINLYFLIAAIITTASCSKPIDKIEQLLNNDPLISSEKLVIDESGLSLVRALVKTVRGNVEIKFYPQQAPNTVTRVLELIQDGFYDGLTLHHVLHGVLVQTGDPSGQGFGGSGVKLRAEKNNILHGAGMVAMARKSSPDSADSQFYITLKPLPELDGKYTVFAKVSSGLKVLKLMIKGDKIISISLIRPQ